MNKTNTNQTYIASQLKNQLLVAMPILNGTRFEQTVTYLCEHSEKGAMGIVINKPSNMALSEVLKQLNIDADDMIANYPVLNGGPVAKEQGFLIHQSPPYPGEMIVDTENNIVISASKEVLRDFAEGKGPEKMLVSLGYAGWDGGQLESELRDNRWLLAPANPHIVFEMPYAQRWQASAGVDFSKLTNQVGHS